MKSKFMKLTNDPIGENWCYFYLHINGELIQKRKEYTSDGKDFDESPFCKVYWKMDKDRRLGLYEVLIAAAISGAKITSVENMAKIHGVTDEDAKEYCRKANLICTDLPDGGDFKYSVSYATLPGQGLGHTVLAAAIDFAELYIEPKENKVI